MSSANDIIEQIRREIALRARLEPEQIAPDAHFIRDLGMSSLDVLNVLAFTEKTLEARFPDEALAELTTLERIIGAVRSHEAGKETGS